MDSWYERICQAYGRTLDNQEADVTLPRAPCMNTEELAACSIRQLLSNAPVVKKPELGMLIDCRSSAAIGGSAPTYRLAAITGLQRILPISLSAQAGTEVAQALFFLELMLNNTDGMAVVSAVQRVVPPDRRNRDCSFPLADASAALLVSTSPVFSSGCFQLLAVALEQTPLGTKDNHIWLFEQVLQKAGLDYKDVKWSIAHRYSDEFCAGVIGIRQHVKWLNREEHLEVNFGCADSLISLRSISEKQLDARDDVGILWFRGEFGAGAAVLLKWCG